MKLIVDIPEEAYNDIQSRDWKNGELIFSEEWKAIHNGTPIPDNATNGDMIKAMFADSTKYEFAIEDSLKIATMFVISETSQAFYVHFDLDWWNALYQKGGK